MNWLLLVVAIALAGVGVMAIFEARATKRMRQSVEDQVTQSWVEIMARIHALRVVMESRSIEINRLRKNKKKHSHLIEEQKRDMSSLLDLEKVL